MIYVDVSKNAKLKTNEVTWNFYPFLYIEGQTNFIPFKKLNETSSVPWVNRIEFHQFTSEIRGGRSGKQKWQIWLVKSRHMLHLKNPIGPVKILIKHHLFVELRESFTPNFMNLLLKFSVLGLVSKIDKFGL